MHEEENRRPLLSRSLPGEHTVPNSLPASLSTTTNINLAVQPQQQRQANTSNTNTFSNISSSSPTRRSLSTSNSSQSLLKKSLSIKPRAQSNLYPAATNSPTTNNNSSSSNSPLYSPSTPTTTTTESDTSNRSSFEDFDYSSPGTGSISSSSSLNSPLFASSTSDTSTTNFPFYTRERHQSLVVFSGRSSNITTSLQGNQVFPQPTTTTSAPTNSTIGYTCHQLNSNSSSASQPQFSSPQSLFYSHHPQQQLFPISPGLGSAGGGDDDISTTTSTSLCQQKTTKPMQRRPSGASSQLKRLLNLKSENYPSNPNSLYSDSETDSIETDSDAYVTNDEQSSLVLSSSMKRRPSFQRSPTHRFFPDLSVDAEENHLSNLHIIDEGSPEFTFPKVKRKLLKDLEETKCRADKSIMQILETWYQSYQYQELLSELFYDGWSDDDDKQSSPIAVRRSNSQRTLSKSATSLPSNHKKLLTPSISPTTYAQYNNNNKQITHKMESISLHGDTKPKDIIFQRKASERRLIHSNSWPQSILASSHTLLLTRIDRIARRILKTVVHDLLNFNVAVEIMKELQELMKAQRNMAVGNADAEELLTKLVYVFADVTRAVEAVNHSFTETNPELSGDGGNKDDMPTTEKRKSLTSGEMDSKLNSLLPPQPAFSSPLARHVSTPIKTQHSSFKVSLEQRRASANEAIFESPIMYVPPPRPCMDDNLLTWSSLTRKQVDQLLHEEMNREIDFGIILKKQQEDIDPESKKKAKKSRPVMNFLKSLKNAFHSPTSSTSVSPTGSPTRSMVQPSPMRNTHLPKPPQPEKSRSLSFDSQAFTLSRRSSSIVPNTINSGFSMYDYILCRICEEMIPSHELDAHSEICVVTTDYAIKLQECDGRLRRLVSDVAKRKAEILVRIRCVKDAEMMEEIGLK
ncbi:8585_t:CDS:2 [Funneliformis caledonium]|uniref:8585_t:CDS:1 n=1 Tax=Funneliformis caledonium TaxID=1117310 RepID=A0A9N9FEF0_9GLOM|nr:8585_t:CDS:2 [Funneliformis caledonium]